MIRALLVLLCLAAPAWAQRVDPARLVAVDVLPGWRGADGVQVAGLRVRLAPGWKTYWRVAGAAGLAPRMDWRGSGNVRSVTPAWPVPTVWGAPGALSIGYDAGFVLPLLIPAAGPGPVRLRGVLDIGVCAHVCIPVTLRVAADLPPGGAIDPAIAAALDRGPARVAAPARCSLRPVEGGIEIAAEIDLAPLGPSEAVVFELPRPGGWIADAAVRREGGRLHAVSRLHGTQGRPLSVDRSDLAITVLGGGRGVEIAGCAG